MSGQPPLLLHAFPTFAVGGAQARFTTIANHFGLRWRHAVFAMDGNLAARERLDRALDVTFPAIALTKGDTLGNLRRLRAALKALRPDTLVTHNWGTIEWAMANRWPLVRHVHVEDGFGPEERTRQLPRRVWTRRLMLARRTLVVPSMTLQRIALQQWRLNPARVRYLPNGVDLSRFETTPALRLPGDGPAIGTVAALRPEKNLARLLRAFALAAASRPGHLVVIGDGAERTRLEALAAQLGIAHRVHWAGHQHDPAPLLRGLDVFAMSSDTEQMPISLLEAMACSLPVAATNVGDIAAILPDVQRPYVTAPDDEALGAALSALLEDAGLRARLGAANRARAMAGYGEARMFKDWAEVWGGEMQP